MRVDEASVRLVIRALRGAPMTVLVTMLMLGLHSETEISQACGYSPRTVRDALGALELHGLAVRVARYAGWGLSDGARQMLLPGVGECEGIEFGVGERQSLPLPSSSSSHDISVGFRRDFTETSPETTTTADRKKVPLPALTGGASAAFDSLVSAGCGRARADAAVRAALAGGWDEETVGEEAAAWVSFALTQVGHGVDAPAYLAAARVAACEECRVFPVPVSRDDEARAFLASRVDQLTRR